MITRIREVRQARRLTLDEVAQRCDPPTTPQTIGRLETGARTVSLPWLHRIANAMDVRPEELVSGAEQGELKLVAEVGPAGAAAPKRGSAVPAPAIRERQVALRVTGSIGEYRAGDEVWCDVLERGQLTRALNRDILVPRSGDRFVFGRCINHDGEKLHVLPLDPGARQQVVAIPSWVAVTATLIRKL